MDSSTGDELTRANKWRIITAIAVKKCNIFGSFSKRFNFTRAYTIKPPSSDKLPF